MEARLSARWHRGSKADWLLGEEATVRTTSKRCLKDEWRFAGRKWGGRASRAGGIASAKTKKCAGVCCTQRAAELDTQLDTQLDRLQPGYERLHVLAGKE